MNILQSLSSSKDLYTIIRTSSLFYRIFISYKQSILSAILLRAIPEEVEADFVLAHRAQRIWKLVPEPRNYLAQFRGYYHRDRDTELFDSLNLESIALLDQFEPAKGGRQRLPELVSHRTLLLDMWKFYCNFEHLIGSYSTRALLLLNPQQPSSDSNEPLLSFTEQTRLQRAFFRWEVYTCLFQISQVFSHDVRFEAPSTDPAPRFAAMLRSWEVEEISCVAQFYKTLVEELSDRIEEDFVTTAKEKMDARAILNGGTVEGDDVELNLELSCLSWYEESHKGSERAGHNDYLVSRGMLSVRKLASAPFPIARKMVVSSDPEAHNKISMFLGLQYSTPREEIIRGDEGDFVERRSTTENDSDDDDCLGNCNFGWLWAAVEDSARRSLNAHANYELRNQGYVFWDNARLLQIEKFQSPRAPVEDFYEFPPGYQEHSKRPGIGTKLRDVPMPRDVVDEISRDIFGDDRLGPLINWRN